MRFTALEEANRQMQDAIYLGTMCAGIEEAMQTHWNSPMSIWTWTTHDLQMGRAL